MDNSDPPNPPTFDTFDADGALSREFLLARGHCCANGCKNCPYKEGSAEARTADPDQELNRW